MFFFSFLIVNITNIISVHNNKQTRHNVSLYRIKYCNIVKIQLYKRQLLSSHAIMMETCCTYQSELWINYSIRKLVSETILIFISFRNTHKIEVWRMCTVDVYIIFKLRASEEAIGFVLVRIRFKIIIVGMPKSLVKLRLWSIVELSWHFMFLDQ